MNTITDTYFTTEYMNLFHNHMKAIDSGNCFTMYKSLLDMYDYTGDGGDYDLAMRFLKLVDMDDLVRHFNLI